MGGWNRIAFESAHQIDRWQALMRGDARVKKDVDVTPEDIRRYHLVLWGDPASNPILGKIADRLPIAWGEQEIRVGDATSGKTFDAATHVPVMIYPNPANPQRYVVLNSGLTFREAHDRTNSQQNPKLPDWAIVDLSEPPGPQRPGRIAAAGFFDEQWKLKDE